MIFVATTENSGTGFRLRASCGANSEAVQIRACIVPRPYQASHFKLSGRSSLFCPLNIAITYIPYFAGCDSDVI